MNGNTETDIHTVDGLHWAIQLCKSKADKMGRPDLQRP